MIPTKLIAAGIAVIVILAALGAVWAHYTGLVDDKARLTAELYQERAQREAERATFQETNAANLKTIHALELDAIANANTLARHVEKTERIIAQRDENRAKLDSWRTALENETLKRPAVVARAARAGINRSMRHAADITATRSGEGDDTRGEGGAIDPATPATVTAGEGYRAGSGDAGGNPAMEPGSR